MAFSTLNTRCLKEIKRKIHFEVPDKEENGNMKFLFPGPKAKGVFIVWTFVNPKSTPSKHYKY